MLNQNLLIKKSNFVEIQLIALHNSEYMYLVVDTEASRSTQTHTH